MKKIDIITQILILKQNADVAVVELLINKTKREVVLYCRRDYDPRMDNIVVDIVLFKLNQLGNEGISGLNYNGISENYLVEYPTYIKSQLNSLRKNVIFK